jgi:hypothetical protein
MKRGEYPLFFVSSAFLKKPKCLESRDSRDRFFSYAQLDRPAYRMGAITGAQLGA